MMCQHMHCVSKATRAPKIFVPAMGWPQEQSRALSFVVGLKLCRFHCKDVNPLELMPDLEKLAGIAARASGSKIPPDCERAWIVPLSIDSEEFRKFEEMSKKK